MAHCAKQLGLQALGGAQCAFLRHHLAQPILLTDILNDLDRAPDLPLGVEDRIRPALIDAMLGRMLWAARQEAILLHVGGALAGDGRGERAAGAWAATRTPHRVAFDAYHLLVRHAHERPV